MSYDVLSSYNHFIKYNPNSERKRRINISQIPLLSVMKNLIPIIAYFFLATTLSSSSSSSSFSSISSIYDVMRSHDLPPGLFPLGITNFTISTTTGKFTAFLNRSCVVKFETDVHYHRNISGTIRHGEISDMAGVSAQDLFLWFAVKSIRVDFPTSGVVHFDVGVVRKQFSLSMFENPQECKVYEADPPITNAADSVGLKRRSIYPQKPVKTIESEQEDQVTVLRSAT